MVTQTFRTSKFSWELISLGWGGGGLALFPPSLLEAPSYLILSETEIECVCLLHSWTCCRPLRSGEQPGQSRGTPENWSGACCRSRCISSHHPGWSWPAAMPTWRQCRAWTNPGDVCASGRDLRLTWGAVRHRGHVLEVTFDMRGSELVWTTTKGIKNSYQ